MIETYRVVMRCDKCLAIVGSSHHAVCPLLKLNPIVTLQHAVEFKVITYPNKYRK